MLEEVQRRLVPTEWEFYDDKLAPYRGDRSLEHICTGMGWAEGPVWVAAGRYLLWSDIPGNRILRYDEACVHVGVFAEPSNNTNGHTLDPLGRVLHCEHRARRVTRTEHDGSTSVLAQAIGGKRFNSPNDVVTQRDGTIWFTDPDYGIRSYYEGLQAEPELGRCGVYRLDDSSGTCTEVIGTMSQPNGLCFSPDEKWLYVADSGTDELRRFAVEGGEVVADHGVIASGASFDGVRSDDAGRIWAAAGKGVNCYAPDGAPLGRFSVPELVANLTFGGTERNRLFITATSSLYALRVGARGVLGRG